MKKLLALLAALALLLSLFGCDWFTKSQDDDVTTTSSSKDIAPTSPHPPPSPSPMEPLQGGPMLYTFFGSEPYRTAISEFDGDEYPLYPIGLIDRDGKLVSPPVYHNVDYIYAEDGRRVIGLAAVAGRAIKIYELTGESRTLPCEGYRIDVFPGGRYAVVNTAEYPDWTGGDSIDEPQREGLFDLKENKFAIEPKDGLMIDCKTGGAALCYQYDSLNIDSGSETAQWAFICADGSTIDLPLSMGRVQDYYPETGWFGSMWMQGAWEQRVYGKDLQIIPALTGWSIDAQGFRGGEWCMIYNNSAFPGVSTWVNRRGELSGKRLNSMPNTGAGWQCCTVEENGQVSLLDANLNEAAKAKKGELIAALWNMGDSAYNDGFALVAADGSVKAVHGLDAKPFQVPAGFRCWFNDVTEGIYASLGGQFVALDLKRFFPTPKAEHKDATPYAHAVAVCEDYVVVETGIHWWEIGASYETFAVDWQGNRLDDCPLAPFFGLINHQTAGPQGPFYHWIETPAQRGYINTKGEWLFVDEG